jgi:hypothetical protein
MSESSSAGAAASEAAIRAHFIGQAEACEKMGSPFTGKLCRVLSEILDHGTTTGRRVLSWPGVPREDALSLRLCGGLHEIVLTGDDASLASLYPPTWEGGDIDHSELRTAILRNDARLLAALDSPPQTNEIARSAMLLPGFLEIAHVTGLPLDLAEIGSSAGLNLLFDRFRYDYAGAAWGKPDSPVQLAPAVEGMAPPLGGDLRIAGRAGCDIAPVDVSNPADRLRLRSYIWADQAARLARLDAAIGLAATDFAPPETVDAAEFVARRLAARHSGTAFVLFHSIMWQYMPAATREAIAGAMRSAGAEATADAPVAWLTMEPEDVRDPRATLALTIWPGGERRRLALCDYHGRTIAWGAAAG